MGKIEIPIGTQFEYLEVLEETPSKGYKRNFRCICLLCKRKAIYRMDSLRGGKATRCFGCSRNLTKHGGAVQGNRSKDYNRWLAIKQRTLNPNHQAYKNYGGRGIKLHNIWLNNPALFMDYIQSLPNADNKALTLDRVHNDYGYEPMNLRWVTKEEQEGNKR